MSLPGLSIFVFQNKQVILQCLILQNINAEINIKYLGFSSHDSFESLSGSIKVLFTQSKLTIIMIGYSPQILELY